MITRISSSGAPRFTSRSLAAGPPAYRASACRLDADLFEGGSLADVVHAQCLERVARQRRDALRRTVALATQG